MGLEKQKKQIILKLTQKSIGTLYFNKDDNTLNKRMPKQ